MTICSIVLVYMLASYWNFNFITPGENLDCESYSNQCQHFLIYYVISDVLVVSLQIHLFDIDIPGKITFIESLTLTAGDTPTIVDTGLICS